MIPILRTFAGAMALLCFCQSFPYEVFAADIPEPPAAATSGVIEKKTREELEDLLEQPKPVPKLSLDEPIPEEKETGQQEFFVQRIRLEGNTLLPQEEVEKFLSAFEQRMQTIPNLKWICMRLEGEFQKHGYVVVVYMPPQRLEKQEVTLKVLPSKMGALHLEGARYFKEAQTLSYWDIPKGEILRLEEVRQNVLRMNENPDRRVKVSLKAGAEPGATDIYLLEQDQYPFHTGVAFDNQGNKLTGKKRGSFNFKFNNLTGRDDIFFVSAAAAKEVGVLYLYHLLPILAWNARLATHFSHALVTPKKEFTAFDIQGISEDYGFELRRYIFKREDATLDGHIDFTFNEKRTRVLGATTTRDRLRMPAFGLDYQGTDRSGIWNLEESFTFGLPFNDDNIALMSRQAGSSFSKFNFHVKRIQRLDADISGIFNMQCQLTPDNLTPQEQMFFGGVNSIRGYPESDYGADYGIMTNVEFWLPPLPLLFVPDSLKLMNFERPLKDQVNLILFADHGYGRLNKSTENEHATRNLFGIGVGFNFSFHENLQASISWGFPMGDRPLTEAGKSQCYFKIQSNF